MIGIQIWHCPGCDKPMKRPRLVSIFASDQNPGQVYPYALCARCTKKVAGRPPEAAQAFFARFEVRLIGDPQRYGTAATGINEGFTPLDKVNPKLAALFKRLTHSAGKHSVAK